MSWDQNRLAKAAKGKSYSAGGYNIPEIKKYLSFGLFPKAGVTIGLAMLIKEHQAFSNIASIMINAILASVIINELIAPFLTKYMIFKVGEAGRRE